MNKLTISIFGNKIFLEIIKELKLFSKYTISFYEDFNLCLENAILNKQLVIFFTTDTKKKDYVKLEKNNLPLIIISQAPIPQNILSADFTEKLSMPFSVLDLQKKVITLLAKREFKQSSLINLCGYIIDKNERKIKKNNLELQLTEKEVNFLILFSKINKPLSRNFVLKNVWKYSPESDTHTVETHIHRLRKKILNKFNDDHFIKNDDKGYYI